MSLTQKVFTGSAFQIAFNLAQRLIGIISTLILARLLTPTDFGTIAVLMLIIHLAELLTDAGSKQYIIQNQNSDIADLNTAWTFDILSKSVLTIIICLSAPWLADYLDNPEITDAARILSLAIPLRAVQNPQLILFAKEFEYHKLFKLQVSAKLISFVCVIGIAIFKPSYWAIIVGDLVSGICLVIGSYLVCETTPHLTLSRIRQQWSFSQWALLRGITGYARSQADMLIAAKHFPTAGIGSYHLQRELALMPALSVIIPACEPLLSAIAKSKHDYLLLQQRIYVSTVALIALLLPITAFIILESHAIVRVFLGEQWADHHMLLCFFSLMFAAYSFHALISDSFVALGKIKELFAFDIASTLLLGGILLSQSNAGLEAFALTRGAAGLGITLALWALLHFTTGLHLLTSLINVTPTILGIAGAIIGAHALDQPARIDLVGSIIHLMLQGGIFILSWILCFLIATHLLKNKAIYNYDATNQIKGFIMRSIYPVAQSLRKKKAPKGQL